MKILITLLLGICANFAQAQTCPCPQSENLLTQFITPKQVDNNTFSITSPDICPCAPIFKMVEFPAPNINPGYVLIEWNMVTNLKQCSYNMEPAGAFRMGILFGSLGGTAPGIPIDCGDLLPLNQNDSYFNFLLNGGGYPIKNNISPLYHESVDIFDFESRPYIIVSRTQLANFIGLTFNHAFVVCEKIGFNTPKFIGVSNAQPLQIVL